MLVAVLVDHRSGNHKMNNDPLRISYPGLSGDDADAKARELIDAWRDEWHLEPEPEMDNGTFKIYESLVGYVARALQTAATPTSERLREAAEEIADLSYARHREEKVQQYIAILSRYFGEAKQQSAEQCSATCKEFSMHTCDVAHRCILDAGHPFDPMYGQIHEFEAHQTTVKPRSG